MERIRLATLFDGGPHGVASPLRAQAILEEEVAKLMRTPAGSRWVDLGNGRYVDCAAVMAIIPNAKASRHGEPLALVALSNITTHDTALTPAEVMAAVDAARAWVRRNG